jgi:hypothetical protein
MFRGSIGMLRDMLTPLAYIGKGFRKSCGIHFVYFTIDTHPNIRVMSLLRLESLDVVLLLLFPNILSFSGNLLRQKLSDVVSWMLLKQQPSRLSLPFVNSIRRK